MNDIDWFSCELSPSKCEISVDYTEEFDPQLNRLQGQVHRQHLYILNFKIQETFFDIFFKAADKILGFCSETVFWHSCMYEEA